MRAQIFVLEGKYKYKGGYWYNDQYSLENTVNGETVDGFIQYSLREVRDGKNIRITIEILEEENETDAT